MKTFNRNISIVLIILFVLVTFYAAIDLLSLPNDILESIGISENTKIEQARKVAFSSYTVLIIDFFIVLLLIFMFSMNNINHMAENIVYVEKEKQAEDQENYRRDGDNIAMEESLHKLQSLSISEYDSDKKKFEKLLAFVCNEVKASAGALYTTVTYDNLKFQEFVAGYAFYMPDSEKLKFEFGEGLVGQAAKSGNDVIISEAMPQGYIKITSGLGEAEPNNLSIIPIKIDEDVKGVLEIASFSKFNQSQINFLKEASSYIISIDDVESEIVEQEEENI